uniref:RusA family crossover junction endodeoxyribonuclease n=1 Tax=Thomasclavelia spiroformis TaxID=29348 RepID=UPI00359CAC03
MFGEVIGKGRPRFTKSGRTYTPKKTLDYERTIKRAYLNKYTYLSKKSLRIKICAYLEVAKSHSKVKKQKMLTNELQCTKKPDIDNIVKVVLDALNKVAYQDDTQVVELVAIKRWSNTSKLKVVIEEIGETMN